MPSERRRRLVEIASAEFASEGYEHASLNRVIDACGMSKSSFYYFLPSKAELFDFVVRELIDEVASNITIPDAGEFIGRGFWPRLEEFFSGLVRASQQQDAFLTLGRMFYSEAPDAAATSVSGTLAVVRTWVEGVLRVGRQSGAVRDDLPDTLQYGLVFGILQVFDQWTVEHYQDFAPADLRGLAQAQFATIRRVLEP
ncbi:TetR/AcrR family transcriptional regulator [Mycobacterium sp.]|uniref:TetR/AcrR family transcriptional regulator n=1 Tax=Mycobacterium sp. TaxID=1785 RepID=UPI002D9751EB|nr:TetR/AcrR family transcriptional regulator [Mycobacterium sp.]